MHDINVGMMAFEGNNVGDTTGDVDVSTSPVSLPPDDPTTPAIFFFPEMLLFEDVPVIDSDNRKSRSFMNIHNNLTLCSKIFHKSCI